MEVMQHLWTCSLTRILLQRQIVSSILNAPDEFEGESNWVGKSTKSTFQQKKPPNSDSVGKSYWRFESGMSVQSESESRT